MFLRGKLYFTTMCNLQRTWKNNAENQKVRVTSMGKDVGKLESSFTAGRKGSVTLENSLAVPQMFNIEMPYDPAVLLLGIYA